MSTKNINVRHSELVSESSSFLNSKKLNQKISPRAFTLIELIVVVTILTILGAIGFVTMTGYFAGARDSARLSDMNSIYEQLNLTAGMEGNLPFPDDYRTIVLSGTTITYQGYAGKTVLSAIKFEKGGRDPKDDVYYSYTINTKKSQAQLLGYFEEYDTTKLSKINPFIPRANATTPTDYSDRKIGVLGKKIGTLIDATTFALVQQTSTGTFTLTDVGTGYMMYFNNTTVGSGAGTDLKTAFLANSIASGSLGVGTTPLVVINASCGQNATTYVSASGAFLGSSANDFCATVNSTLSGGINPSFPSAGASVSWTCNSLNGGTNVNCSSLRWSPLAICGNTTDFSKITLDCPVGCSTVGTICGGGLIAGTNLVVSRSGCNGGGTTCDGSTDSFGAAWKTSSSGSPGVDSTSNGAANTLALTNTQSLKDQHPAASYCSDMSVNNFNDWYLPSQDEINQFRLGKNAGILLGWNPTNNVYWSSTQISTNNPLTWNIGWNNVSSSWDFTNTMPRVRCARKIDSCGPAARSYTSSNNGSDFGGIDSFCAPGKTLSSTIPSFPTPGNNSTWSCAGGGQESTCTVTRLPIPLAICGNTTDFSKITLDCPVGCSTVGTICGGGLIAGTNLVVSRSGCNGGGTTCDGSTDSFGAAWKTSSSGSPGVDSTSNGAANTLALTNTQSLKDQHPAASYCSDMSVNNFNDWYLPSQDEINQFRLGKNAGILLGWNPTNNVYWSSTQMSTNNPLTWNIGWNNVSSSWDFTNTMPRVRCARKF